MCFIDDGDDRCVAWEETFPFARFAHRCDECFQPIAIGERYQSIYWRGAESGRQTFRTCGGCVMLRDAVKAHELAEGCDESDAVPPVGYLWEAAREIRLIDLVTDGEDVVPGETTYPYHWPSRYAAGVTA